METNRPRDNQGRFTADSKDERNITRCPECGKIIPIEDIRGTHFCSRICETNYRYRMKHMDPMTGNLPNPKDVKKW